MLCHDARRRWWQHDVQQVARRGHTAAQCRLAALAACRAAPTLGFPCHSSFTTSRASTVRCHLSARRNLTRHREVRTLPSQRLPTTALTAATEWRSWDATSQLHQSQRTLLGWQPKAFGKQVSVFQEAVITAMIPSQKQSKRSTHLLSSTPNTLKELGSQKSGVTMHSRTTEFSIWVYSHGASSVTSLTVCIWTPPQQQEPDRLGTRG
jgi:hypothetical protein